MKDWPDTETMNIILTVPRGTVLMEVEAVTLDEDRNVKTWKKTIRPWEVAECRRNFLEYLGGDDYNVEYVLTDKE